MQQDPTPPVTAPDDVSHFFVAYGLTIGSSLPLPELTAAPPGPCDLVVTEGDVPESLPAPDGHGVCFEVSGDTFLLKLPLIARYLVSAGRQIVFEPADGADPEAVRLFLLGSAIGAALHQKGLLPLHGSSVRVGEYAAVFTGFSGHGKSTLAAGLSRRGFPVLADDVSVVSVAGERPMLSPGYPQLKVWGDVLEKIDTSADGLRRVRAELEKFALPLGDAFCSTPTPLERVYVLTPRNQPDVRLVPLEGIAKFRALLNQTYRPRFIASMGLKSEHFARCAEVARHVAVTRIHRPHEQFLLDDLLDQLERDWAWAT